MREWRFWGVFALHLQLYVRTIFHPARNQRMTARELHKTEEGFSIVIYCLLFKYGPIVWFWGMVNMTLTLQTQQ